MAQFELTLNGRTVKVTVANEETSLLAVLRDAFGLVGTRFGCGLEQCGCCMVLIDGAPQKSCAKPIWSVAGKSITTIEGLGTPEHPHPLQKALLTSRTGNALIDGEAVCTAPRHCSTAVRAHPGPRSRRRSTTTSVAAARITASCARSRKPPPCSARPHDDGAGCPFDRRARRAPGARPVGRVTGAGKNLGANRQGRDRPRRADRHAATGRRGARRRAAAHRDLVGRHGFHPERRFYGR